MKSHPIDPFSLVLGLALLIIGIVGFTGDIDLDGVERSALVPFALLVVAAAIVSSLRRASRPADRDDRERKAA